MFEPSVYIDRRNKLKAALGSGLLLFLGHGESPINYAANAYPFRQDSSFLYFFGLDRPDLAAIMDLDADRAVVFGQDPTPEEIIWTGPRPSLLDHAGLAGVNQTGSPTDLERYLQTALRSKQPIHYLPPYRGETMVRLQRLLGHSAPSRALTQAVIRLRTVKSLAEIEEIEAAVALSQQIQVAVMGLARPGRTEAEMMAAMMNIALAAGAQPAFPPLVSVQGHILHPPNYEKRLAAGDLLINDSGFESPRRYASDISRTVPVSGRFTTRQQEIYEIVLGAQAAALEAIRPGVLFRDAHLLACRVLASGLKDVGLMKGDPAEAVAAGAHALFFPCGLGHMMGLDVHDMEDLGEDLVGYDQTTRRSTRFGLKSLRLGRAVEPGFVMTVEPGLYFMPHLMDIWRAAGLHADFIDYGHLEDYRNFTGLRVEDDVLVTATGCRVLGPPIPKTVEKIQGAMVG